MRTDMTEVRALVLDAMRQEKRSHSAHTLKWTRWFVRTPISHRTIVVAMRQLAECGKLTRHTFGGCYWYDLKEG